MFEEIPVNQQSLKLRRPLYGRAINDAPYKVSYKVDGKTFNCPYYSRWSGIVNRCYSEKLKTKRPTYENCSLEEEWHSFMQFRAWMRAQTWEGLHLDKDVLVLGNKHYGPETCAFITPALNNVFTLRNRFRGDLPLGVSLTKIKGHSYYIASCSMWGAQKRLGYFSSPEEASKAYQQAKLNYISELSKTEPDIRVRQALVNIVKNGLTIF